MLISIGMRVGVLLSTLDAVQSGNPDFILTGSLINVRKRRLLDQVITDLRQWQTQTHNFQKVSNISAFIETELQKYNDQRTKWSDTFWSTSLEREPREREDERLAALMSESGFL